MSQNGTSCSELVLNRYYICLKRSYEIMKFLMWIVVIFGGGIGLLSTLYIVVSLFAMIGFKIYRKIRYGMSLYE